MEKAASSVIRQKGESQNGCFKKKSTPNFPKNEHLPPDTHTYLCVSGGKKCSLFGKFGVLYFLETPVLRFYFSTYYRRYLPLVKSQYPHKLGRNARRVKVALENEVNNSTEGDCISLCSQM